MLKEQIFEIIKSSSQSAVERERWLAAEFSDLGLQYDGLDDMPLDSILVLASLFAFGEHDSNELHSRTGIVPEILTDYADMLNEFSLARECPSSCKYQLTDNGEHACRQLFNNVVIRKRLVLKGELQDIEPIYSRLNELFQ